MLVAGHAGLHVINQGATHIETILKSGHFRIAAIHDNRCTLFLGTIDIADDLFHMLCCNHRTEIIAAVTVGANLQRLHSL